jgi:hypothetical protein
MYDSSLVRAFSLSGFSNHRTVCLLLPLYPTPYDLAHLLWIYNRNIA